MLFAVISTLVLSGCGYNQFQSLDEQVSSDWAEVVNQYQRRSDLVPNLVEVVKGYATHEKETLTGVIEARAKATSVQVTPEALKDPEAMKNFQKAQGELSSFLSKLMMVTEQYPNLKADARFQELQAQIEGTENRITVARNRYIKSVQAYNLQVRSFPTNLTAMLFDYEKKAQFTVENEEQVKLAPKVSFK